MSSKGKRQFGSIRRLPSGRYQARYTGPDGGVRKAPVTFDARIDAEAWLARERGQIVQGTWLPVAESSATKRDPAKSVTFGAYAASWLPTREVKGKPLATTTRDHYAQLLRDHILPRFGNVRAADISPADVRAWHAALKTGPTARAHAYGLLRTIMATAVADDVIPVNPCRVRGAGSTKRAKRVVPASLGELETIAASVPPRYRLMVLLASWCALRFGELAELRRADVDVKAGVVHVRRGVTRTKGGRVVGGPKSDAGKRTVAIPPHLLPAVKAHLREHVRPAQDALVFRAASGGHLAPASLYRVFYPAREAAGRPDLRFHDLRHTGATLAAATGATLAELMARLGHSTPGAAMRYQHAAADRDKVIAAALSELAAGTVTPISAGGKRKRTG
jgi:integrase